MEGKKSQSEKKKPKSAKESSSSVHYSEDELKVEADALDLIRNRHRHEIVRRASFAEGTNVVDEMLPFKQQVWHLRVKQEKHTVTAKVLGTYCAFIIRFLSAAIFLVIALYVLYILWSDVEAKTRARQEEILFQIEKCRDDYITNKCNPKERLRELEAYCIEKERCMNRDPYKEASRTVQTLGLFAESITSFFDSMSLKAICCLFAFVFFPLCAGLCCFKSNYHSTNS